MISELDPNIKLLLPLNRAQKKNAYSLFFIFYFLHISIKSSLNNKNTWMDVDAICAMPWLLRCTGLRVIVNATAIKALHIQCVMAVKIMKRITMPIEVMTSIVLEAKPVNRVSPLTENKLLHDKAQQSSDTNMNYEYLADDRASRVSVHRRIYGFSVIRKGVWTIVFQRTVGLGIQNNLFSHCDLFLCWSKFLFFKECDDSRQGNSGFYIIV